MTSATDESVFAAQTEQHRRELHVHCYRMLASFDEAEDAVQETFLKAWRSRDTFDGSSLFRAWLYRIATNVCLDLLRQSSRRPTAAKSFAELPQLQPYPDRLLDEIAPTVDQPDTVAVERETIELAFLAALQVLPPRQRAAFVVRDLLGWPAADAASLLDTSVVAANSALQGARVTMQERLPARRADWSAGDPSPAELSLLEQFIDAHERCDAAAALPSVQIRRPADRGRPDRGDHHVRTGAVPGLRTGAQSEVIGVSWAGSDYRAGRGVGPKVTERGSGATTVTEPEVLLKREFDVDNLAEVRERAYEAVSGVGVAANPARSFVYSINEGMTNAIRHGGGSGELTITRVPPSLFAEVHNPGVAAPFSVPDEPPPPGQPGGRGLWLAHQLTDRLTVRTGPSGTAIVLELFLNAA